MALFVFTDKASELLSAVKAAIDGKHIDTWRYDKDGDFTHSPEQWVNRAWLRPSIAESALTFGIIGRKSDDLTKEEYAVYHGRFVEMLLAHFDKRFSTIQTTALMQQPDILK
jgi:hypothetical protein